MGFCAFKRPVILSIELGKAGSRHTDSGGLKSMGERVIFTVSVDIQHQR